AVSPHKKMYQPAPRWLKIDHATPGSTAADAAPPASAVAAAAASAPASARNAARPRTARAAGNESSLTPEKSSARMIAASKFRRRDPPAQCSSPYSLILL